MSLLVETICIENKALQHIDLHNERFNRSRKALFNLSDSTKLENLIHIPNDLKNYRYKCRVTSNGEIIDYTIKPYQQRKIQNLKLVYLNNIEYSHKTDQRQLLDQAFSQRENCDDIIIVKNGYLSDAWAANIILFDGKKWHTPNTPLLKGTQREWMLRQHLIVEKSITYKQLKHYQKIKLINAMIDFERSDTVDVNNCFL